MSCSSSSLCTKNEKPVEKFFSLWKKLISRISFCISTPILVIIKLFVLLFLLCVVRSEWQLTPQWIAPRRPSFYFFLLSLYICFCWKNVEFETFPFSTAWIWNCPIFSNALCFSKSRWCNSESLILQIFCNSFLKVDASHSESFFKYFASLF